MERKKKKDMGRGPEETFQRHTNDQRAQEKMLRLPWWHSG